jgi:AcrR family transcriptional regulator
MRIVRRTRDEQREDTRRRLLDAARREFLRRGFHGASLDLVAEEAGFTKGAVYSRFASKADLFLALLDERITTRIAEMEAIAAREHGPLGLGTAIGRQWDAKLQQDESWSLLLIEFRLHAARDPEPPFELLGRQHGERGRIAVQSVGLEPVERGRELRKRLRRAQRERPERAHRERRGSAPGHVLGVGRRDPGDARARQPRPEPGDPREALGSREIAPPGANAGT